jgi:hypothetical protein
MRGRLGHASPRYVGRLLAPSGRASMAHAPASRKSPSGKCGRQAFVVSKERADAELSETAPDLTALGPCRNRRGYRHNRATNRNSLRGIRAQSQRERKFLPGRETRALTSHRPDRRPCGFQNRPQRGRPIV